MSHCQLRPGKAPGCTVSVLPCTVLSSGIRKGLALVDSGRSWHSVPMVETGMEDKEKEGG